MLRRSILLGLCASLAAAKDKKKKKSKQREEGPQGVIAGTVFQPSGLSLEGAKITVIDPADEKRKWEGVSDARGEFAVRVPAAGDPKYRIVALFKGLEPMEKEAYAFEAQRTNVNFMMSAAK